MKSTPGFFKFVFLALLSWLTPELRAAADPFMTEAKVQLDVDGMLARLFSKNQYYVQVNTEIATRSERRVVEGETFQGSSTQDDSAQVTMMPGFIPEPGIKAKETITPQQRQIYRIIEVPELKWVRVHVNFHDKLRLESVAQAKLMVQSYLHGNYPDHSVLTFGQMPMIDGDKDKDKEEEAKASEAKKAHERELAELKNPRPAEPTFEEKLWGYAKWASMALLTVIVLMLLVKKSGPQIVSMPQQAGPRQPIPLKSLLATAEKLAAAKNAPAAATAAGASTEKQGDIANVLRKRMLSTVFTRSEAFKMYFQKLADEQKVEFCSLFKGPAFTSYLEGIGEKAPAEEKSDIEDPVASMTAFEKDFEEYSEAKNWQDGQFFGFLRRLTNEQLMTLVNHESPLAVCIMLRFMKPNQSAYVLDAISPEKRLDVLAQVPQLNTVSFSDILMIEKEVRTAMQKVPSHFFGSKKEDIDFWGTVLTEMENQDGVLQDIERTQPEIYPSLKKYRFKLEDAASLPDSLLGKILGDVDNDELALALASCQKDVIDVLLDAVSPRRREMLAMQIEPAKGSPREQISQARSSLTKRFREAMG